MRRRKNIALFLCALLTAEGIAGAVDPSYGAGRVYAADEEDFDEADLEEADPEENSEEAEYEDTADIPQDEAADDTAPQHTVSIQPEKIVTLPGGEWYTEAIADPLIDPPEIGWLGARYEWDRTAEKVKEGYTVYPGFIYGMIRVSGFDPDSHAGMVYENTNTTYISAYTPGEYEVTAQLYTGDGHGKAVNKDGSAKISVSVEEPDEDDLLLLVYDTDSAVIEEDAERNMGLGYTVNEDHSVTFKADCFEQDQEIILNAGDTLNVSTQLNPIGDKWTNRYDNWALTNRYLDLHNYTMEYRWELEGDDDAKAVFVNDPVANLGSYSLINRNISFDTDAAVTEDKTVTVKAYCHYYNLDVVSGKEKTLNLDDECVKSFKITVKAKHGPAQELKLPAGLEMGCGDQLRLDEIEGFEITPGNAFVEYSSSDETVLKIVNGVLKALKPGESTLTLTSGDKSAQCLVMVKDAEYSVSINTYFRWGWTDEDYSILELGTFENLIGTDYGYNIQLRADLASDVILPEGAKVEYKWKSDRPDYVSVVSTSMSGDAVGIANVRAWRYDMSVGTTLTLTATIKDAEGNILGRAFCESKKIYVKGYHLGWGFGKGGCYIDFDASPEQEFWGPHEEGLHGEYYYLNQMYTGAAPITYTAKPSLNGEFITEDDKDVKVSYRWFFVNGGEDEDAETHEDPYKMMGEGQDLTADHITVYPPKSLPDDKWYSAAVYLETTIEYQAQSVTGRQRIVINVIPMEGAVTGISISDEKLELAVGSSKSLSAKITPSDAKNKEVEWSSSDHSVATVDAKGKVTAKGVGEAVITVRSVSGGHEAQCRVNVYIPLKKLMLDKKSLSMAVGTEYKLNASGMGDDGASAMSPDVSFTSSNPSVATVDEKSGLITAVAAGSAKITAKAAYGNKSATCKVKVMAPAGKVTLSVKKGSTSVEAGKTLTIKAAFESSKVADKKLTWYSEDSTIASVNEKGVVTGVSEGEVTIMAVPSELSGASMGSIKITVTAAVKARTISDLKIAFRGVEIPPYDPHAGQITEMTMDVGETKTFTAYGTVDGKRVKLSSKDVVFYGEDASIINVNPNGKVKAVGTRPFCNGESFIVARSLADPSVEAKLYVTTYEHIKKITLNTKKATAGKDGRGVLCVAQFKPENPSNPMISWEASDDAVRLAVLPAGMSVSELAEEDFVTGFVHTDLSKGESLAYLCVKPVKKCVITAATHDGNKKATCTLEIKGKVTKLELKTGNGVTGENGEYVVHMKPGSTFKPETIIEAEYGAVTKLVWSSDTPSVAKVDKNGKISMSKEPEYDCCLITAMTADEAKEVHLRVYVDR